MLSTLFAYQVVGVGWMRWRELSGDDARGGLLCDDMGLGKTVQMLAVIMDGQPDKKALKNGEGSTLIVCTASLVDQWAEEINKHCKPNLAGKVTIYRSAEFAKTTNNPLSLLQTHNIM